MTSLPPQPSTFFTALRWFRLILLCCALCGLNGFGLLAVRAAEPAAPSAQTTEKEVQTEKAEMGGKEGIPLNAPVLVDFGYFKITSSMVWTWIVALGIIIFARYATREIKEVPDGAQNFWEWLVEGLRDFLESIIGRELVKKTFWFFATLFIFILFTNWAGLIPGVGTIGWGVPDAQGGLHHISRPLFRGVNADLNMTLAMSLIFFFLWTVWAFQANGFGGMIMHLFGPKGDVKNPIGKAGMIVIFIIVGLLEIVSILFRPVSLSFRLYGNIFAGENIMDAMSNIYPPLAAIIPIPFYFMELLVGVAQALVFMLLTAVFTMLICTHSEEEHH